MKKKIFIILGVILFLILLIPVPNRLKDGGSVEYTSVLYQVTKVKRLNLESVTGYEEGLIIEILGIEVFNNVKYDTKVNVDYINGVTMSIKDGTLTNSSVVVIIEDLNENKYVYSEAFLIEKRENDKWIEIKTINDDYGFNEMGYLVNEDNKLEMKQDWFKIYGNLEKGKYRLVKSIFDNGYKYFSVEFEI